MKTQVTTAFTKEAIKSVKPKWASWLFRSTAIITTVLILVVASDPGIPDEIKIRAGVYLKGLDMLVLGFSNMFGIKIQEDEK